MQTSQAVSIFSQYRKEAEELEKKILHPRAALSAEHKRKQGADEDHRLPYKRDVDRIVHSKAYSRYIDKTQVVYLVENDHVTHRSLHVQLVSNFARGIAEILRLNLDLVEAISLGHDVGHPPFGHEGEHYLSDLAREFGEGVFTHPWQSCRLFKLIEPLNLGLFVYDGFLCHDGGMSGTVLRPRFNKTWEDHEKDLKQKLDDPDYNIMPGTLEGCLVKLSDTLSYIGRDIEDAIRLNILKREDVPKTHLGTSNSEILGNLARDIIAMSYNQDYIAMSEKAYEALQVLREFNFRHIYVNPKLKGESPKVKRAYRFLFTFLVEDWEKRKEKSFLWEDFLHNKSEAYRSKSTPARLVIDYISGMTDRYFVRTIEKIIIPQSIEMVP